MLNLLFTIAIAQANYNDLVPVTVEIPWIVTSPKDMEQQKRLMNRPYILLKNGKKYYLPRPDPNL